MGGKEATESDTERLQILELLDYKSTRFNLNRNQIEWLKS